MMRRCARGLGLIVLCLSTIGAVADEPLPASADEPAGFRIERVSVALRDEVYYLSADVHARLSEPILEALDRGVPVPVLLTIQIMRERAYLWNETITELEQRYELDRNELTRQYTVRNINIDTRAALPTRQAAIHALGQIEDLPLIDANLLDPEASYLARLRIGIDTDALPVPLRLRALVSSDWRLVSEWHEWRF